MKVHTVRAAIVAATAASALLLPLASAQTGDQAAARVDALARQPWTTSPDPADVGDVRALAQAASGMIWVAAGRQLLRLDGSSVARFQVPGKSGALHDVAFDGSGGLVVAAGEGAYRFDGRRFVALSRPSTGGRPWIARRLLLDRDGVLWLASDDGLLRLDPDAFTLRQGLPGVAVSLLWEDPWGYLWAATETGQIFRRLGTAFQPVNFPLGMGDGVVRCLHADAAGYLWLIRSDRAWRIEGEFRRAGLPRAAVPIGALDGLGVRRCAPEPSGGLWLGTDDGLAYLAADGSVAAVPGVAGAVHDLLASADGSLWVAGDGGLLHFVDPSRAPELPQVLVTATWIDDEQAVTGSTIDMPAGSDRVRLELATPTFRDPAQVRVRYRWGEPDDAREGDWVDLAGAELIFDDPPVGRNALTLQAGRDGRWNEPGTVLWLEREPDFWQTRTFWAAVIAGVGALAVWLLYLRWVGPGHTPLELPEEIDDDVVHLEDLDTDELTVSREVVERARRNIFGERPDDR